MAPTARAATPPADPDTGRQGRRRRGYPYSWSVYRWLDGEVTTESAIGDWTVFATTLAEFLVALRRVDASDGPPPGHHNFYRGGPLTTYADETIRAIDALGDHACDA